MTEGLVELVEILFILYQCRPGEIIKVIHRVFRAPSFKCLDQGQVFPQGHGDRGLFKRKEEFREHGCSILSLLATGQEGEPLEQMHILLVLEECAMKRRNKFGRIL